MVLVRVTFCINTGNWSIMNLNTDSNIITTGDLMEVEHWLCYNKNEYKEVD